jgi:hypothetical protein
MTGLRYRYKPLHLSKPQIRLLKIDHANGSVGHDGTRPVIYASLHHVNLDDLPEYQALSYAWGPLEPTSCIWVDRRPMYIRQNLHDFLHMYLSKPELHREYFWIDQICIDQHLVDEKNHQVQMMADIYRNAQRVLVWLGTHQDSSILLPVFQKLSSLPRGVSPTRHETLIRIGHPSIDAFLAAAPVGTGKALSRLFAMPYWSRHWIVQELLLAKTRVFVYADIIIPDGILWGCEELSDDEPPTTNLRVLLTQAQIPITDDWPSLWFLNDLPTKCENPRDKVYAVQSLVSEGLHIQIDYEKSIKQVFIDASIAYCKYLETRTTDAANCIRLIALSMGLVAEKHRDLTLQTLLFNEAVDHPYKWRADETEAANCARVESFFSTWLNGFEPDI